MVFIKQKAVFQSKFTHLLFVLVILVLVSPLIGDLKAKFPFTSLLFLASIIWALGVLALSKKIFISCVIIAGLAFLLDLAFGLGVIARFQDPSLLITALVYTIFLIMAIVLLVKKLLDTKEVTTDTISGGICIYCLLGFLWALFYYTITYFDKDAFYYQATKSQADFFYFSFNTLTTLGYGDITPLNKWARILANLEAVIGQMYVAIFIAGLVSLYIVAKIKREQKI